MEEGEKKWDLIDAEKNSPSFCSLRLEGKKKKGREIKENCWKEKKAEELLPPPLKIIEEKRNE